MNIREAIVWLQENFYNYMIPITALCVLRVVMCLIEIRHMNRLRDKKFVFRKQGSHYREIGLFVGLFVGLVLACVLPLKPVWIALGVVLAVIGFKIGAKKGDEVDAFWREVIAEMSAEAEKAEQLENAPEIDTSLAGFLDALDVYNDEEEAAAEPAVEEPAVSEEAAEENVEE